MLLGLFMGVCFPSLLIQFVYGIWMSSTHLDLKASNVLVKLSDIESWSDEQVYQKLGKPV